MTPLHEIESRAKLYAEAREKLAAIVSELNAGIEALKRKAMPNLKRAVGSAAVHHDRLKELIELAPELFAKPRTVVFHGIKVGYQKGKGAIEWQDPKQVVKLIRKHYPDLCDTLIVTKETPAKAALALLTVSELRKIGVSSVDAGDEIVIKPTDSAVDKLVDALLKEATEDVQDREAA